MPQAPIVLKSGAVARYPIALRVRFSTQKLVFSDLKTQSFSALAHPLRSSVINFGGLSPGEVSDWLDFFHVQKGSRDTFDFADPWGNLLKYSEVQENAAWTKTQIAAAADTTPDPFGFTAASTADARPRKITVSGTPSNAVLSQSVALLPKGSGNSRTKGLMLTLSVYVKRFDASPPNFTLEVRDNLNSQSFTKSVTPTASWVRESVVAGPFSPDNAGASVEARLRSYSATGSFFVFGAQLELDGSPSAYKETASRGGLWNNCRFSEECQLQFEGVDHGSVRELVVEEWAA